ncbi:MAG: L-dopachrome tautomerase-related protein [Acidobacteriota bacterium]
MVGSLTLSHCSPRARAARVGRIAATLFALIALVALTGVARAQADASAPDFEVVATLDAPPGNVAVTPSGRLILSLHPFGAPEQRVVELLPDGTTRPYPTPAWSGAPGPDGVGIAAIIGIVSDPQGVVWMLDAGSAETPPKLVGWDTRAERLARVIHLPAPIVQPNSFFQDLAVDALRRRAYIADMSRGDLVGASTPAIVVVDLDTGTARRVLHGHTSLQPEETREARMVIDGTPVRTPVENGKPVEPRIGLNPITIDPSYTWVYYGAMSGRSLYRLRADDLADPSLDDATLASRIERYGDKAVSDGISVDGAGNVYITDLPGNGIGVTRPDGRYAQLIEDPQLSWTDGMSYGPDGFFYVTVNQLHRMPPLNNGEMAADGTYRIVRFKPLAPSTVGR